jgi:hypothetical protein
MTDPMEGRMVRAYSHILMARFIDERLPPPARERILPELSDVYQRLPRMKEGELESANDFARMMRAVASTQADPKRAYDLVTEAGVYIGTHALGTFLRLLIKFLRPALFLRKFPELWARDHNFGQFEPDLSAVESKRAVMHVKGVDGYSYIAALCCGWCATPLRAMGCKDVRIVETLSPPPNPQDRGEYRFEVSWS